MGFNRDTIRTARKEHKCELCHGKIKAGEKYHDKACTAFGDETQIYYAKECSACQPVITEFMSDKTAPNEEGYCDEWINEWWHDVKCYSCKKRYPPCAPDGECGELIADNEGVCPEKTRFGTCAAGDTCDEMTHYCRCEKYEREDDK